MDDFGIRVDIHVPESLHQRLTTGMTPEDGVAILQALEGGIVGSKHFVGVYASRQSTWKPLTKRWLEWKRRKGYAAQTWMMSRRSFRSLTTVARISTSGGQALQRRVDITANSLGVVQAEWRIEAPAARGWFARNNDLRPWVSEILPGTATYERTQGMVGKAALKIMRRIVNGA